MKAYLCLIDDPYYEKQSAQVNKEPLALDSSLFDEKEVDSSDYEEVDLLPKEIPEEIRGYLSDHVLFHAHRFMEITRVTKGQVLYIVDRELCLLQPGDIIVFNSLVPHAWFFLDKDVELTDYSFSNMLLTEPISTPLRTPQVPSMHHLFLNVWHTRPAIGKIPIITSSNDIVMKEDFLVSLINSSFRFAHISQSNPNHTVFFDLLNDIDQECQEKQFAYEYILQAKLMEVVAQLFRLHSTNQMSPSQTKPELLLSALEFISQNLHQNLSLETVARHCFLTPQYFSSYFKKHTGMNFSKYLSDLRLERALNALIQTNDSILEIAFQCGFNSKTSFYRAWYSKYQISPSQVRTTYQQTIT